MKGHHIHDSGQTLELPTTLTVLERWEYRCAEINSGGHTFVAYPKAEEFHSFRDYLDAQVGRFRDNNVTYLVQDEQGETWTLYLHNFAVSFAKGNCLKALRDPDIEKWVCTRRAA